jgi:hypothetical protein
MPLHLYGTMQIPQDMWFFSLVKFVATFLSVKNWAKITPTSDEGSTYSYGGTVGLYWSDKYIHIISVYALK